MTKTKMNTFITHLKKSGMVTQVSPWMFESNQEENFEARYVGVKLDESWQEIFSPKDNVMLKFVFQPRKQAFLEWYLANGTPFFKFHHVSLNDSSKWESIFGELKLKLKKEKQAVRTRTDTVGNVYKKLKPLLK